jgi:hypothetical protein
MKESYVDFLIRKLDDLNTPQDMADYYLDEIFDLALETNEKAVKWLFGTSTYVPKR